MLLIAARAAPSCPRRAEGDSLAKKAGDLEASLRKLRQAHAQMESERDRLSSRVKLLEVQLLEAQDTAASTGQHAAMQARRRLELAMMPDHAMAHCCCCCRCWPI